MSEDDSHLWGHLQMLFLFEIGYWGKEDDLFIRTWSFP